ncbi:hypothetical protein [Propionivibrio sp.]|uniref:hypothetical protein n=1 Tax=Propionivibrio sp. TaxID=2212460 RepID=UPI003BF10E32
MDFRSFARVNGVEIGDLRAGDKIHRCPTREHPESKNGAYFFDGYRGWIQNWETGEPPQWWHDPNAKPWNEAEKREWALRRRVAEVEKQKAHATAAKGASVMIASASRDTHPYLKAKGLVDVQALIGKDGELLIPMRDFRDNNLLGVQTICLVDNEWEKKMLHGMRAKGAILRIGPQSAVETFYCEGYATGLSIDIALHLLHLNACVMVCFSAFNMIHVASNMTGRRFVFADNDASLTGEKAAQATGLPWCISNVIGEDANDLHVRAGVMALAKVLIGVRNAKP